MSDLRDAVRALLKRPALTGLAIVVLALGIGVNATVFAALDRLVLSGLPFEHPDRLVMIWGSNPPMADKLGIADRLPVSYGVFDDWQRQARAFERIAIFSSDTDTLTGRGEPEVLGSVHVSGAFFEMLGVQPFLGRTVAPADERADASAVVVLSHALWQRRFGGDPAVLGQSIVLDGTPVTVVGVMPVTFTFPRGAEMPAGFGFRATPDVWRSVALTPERLRRRSRSFAAIARLNAGQTIGQANAELATIASRQQKAFPDTDAGWGARVESMREQLVGDLRPSLTLLTIAAALVLLISCANVASLCLVAGAARQREYAIRSALGATRRQIARQLLLESVCLAAAGAAAGLLLTAWSLPIVGTVLPERVAHLTGLTLDWRAVLFTSGLVVLTALVFGIVPALMATRSDASRVLGDTVRGSSHGIQAARVRRRLVIAETAIAVVLLVAAALLVRSFVRLMDTDAGFATEHITSFSLQLSADSYASQRRVRFFEEVIDRLQTLPGVMSAGAVSSLPLTGTEALEPVVIEHRHTPANAPPLTADFRVVVPGYFETMRIPLKEGRLLQRADNAKDQSVAVIDETMARGFWGDRSAIGRRFRTGPTSTAEPWVTVVGVVGGVRHAGLATPPRPTIYVPHVQALFRRMTVVVRTRPEATTTAAEIRRAVSELDAGQPMTDMRTVTQIVALSAADRRFLMLVLGALAAAAFLLAAVGLYAVVSHTTALRTREVGIRMALGATPGSVRRLVLKDGIALVVVGLVCGLAGAALAAQFLAHWLYGVSRWDLISFAGVPIVFVLVAAAACAMPARRATRVDPVNALRAE